VLITAADGLAIIAALRRSMIAETCVIQMELRTMPTLTACPDIGQGRATRLLTRPKSLPVYL
jgi:hypothetical protein